MKNIKVCYILSYYSPHYIRTETMVRALSNITKIELFQARNTSKGFIRYFQSLWKLLIIRIFHNPDYYILGFRGYEFYWFVRLICLGKILIFDHMMSPYDSLINEKLLVKKTGILSKLIFHYEKSIMDSSNLVTTDTELHKLYFQELFQLSPEKVVAIPLGADESVNMPALISTHSNQSQPFEVLFYGTFLPLHGVEIILKAIKLLENEPIHFTIIGGNKTDQRFFQPGLNEIKPENLNHIPWVNFCELSKYIAEADLGLGGPFGNTGQAGRVITGKTLQFLSSAKCVIIGDNKYDYGFIDKVNCLLVAKGDEKSLANAILWAKNNPEQLQIIGNLGQDLYREKYSIDQISLIIEKVLFSFGPK